MCNEWGDLPPLAEFADELVDDAIRSQLDTHDITTKQDPLAGMSDYEFKTLCEELISLSMGSEAHTNIVHSMRLPHVTESTRPASAHKRSGRGVTKPRADPKKKSCVYTPVMKTRHAVQLVCLLLNANGLSKSNYKSEAELRQWLELCFPGLVLETRKVKKKKGASFAYNEHALYGLEGHEAVHRILVFVREQVALVGATLPDVPSAELFRTEGEYYATLPDGKKLTVTDEMRAKLTGVLGYDPGSLPSPLSSESIQSWWLSHDMTQLALPMELACWLCVL